MLDQDDVIRRIDQDSEAAAKTLPGVSVENLVIITFRLMFLPVICFIRSMVSGKGLSNGSRNFYHAVNEAALKLIIEAKRYENRYSNKIKPVKDSRDFH